jgi:hypothetical protein
MRKREYHYSTDEQVREYLQRTLGIIEQGDVPDDLRNVAFVSIWNAVSGKQVVFEQFGAVPDLAIPGQRH